MPGSSGPLVGGPFFIILNDKTGLMGRGPNQKIKPIFTLLIGENRDFIGAVNLRGYA
jgi:hypothetical protein